MSEELCMRDIIMSEELCLRDRYEACMVLSGVGDALGYNRGTWEFESDGEHIHRQVREKGGLAKLNIKDFPVSDDTVMHLATADALIEVGKRAEPTLPDLYRELLSKYIECMNDMDGRAPGITCMGILNRQRCRTDGGLKIPFNRAGGGCGAAMRAMCIGLRLPAPEQEGHLIAVSVESSRLSHHHPTAYLGALAAALFTAYALRKTMPVEAWGHGLMQALRHAKQYVVAAGDCVKENLESWDYFQNAWSSYLTERGILDGKSKPRFPDCYGVKERDAFYSRVAYRGEGGASGHDAPMIAYDALLRAGDSWEELANHGFFHGGDSDSTAVIAAACWGAMYGFRGVPESNYVNLEYRGRLTKVAQQLYELRDKHFKECEHAKACSH